MRVATWNVEWFTHLFADDGRIRSDEGWSGRRDVRRRDQIDAVAIVMTALDADALMVIEAPDAHARRDGAAALEGFATAFGLRNRRVVMGYPNETKQEIALLYDPDMIEARHDPRGIPRFDAEYRIDLDIDARLDRVRWSKPPLELEVKTRSGFALRMIGVHAKSKAPHGAGDAEALMRIAIANRRKQLAQCIWLRERVDEHLAAGEPLVVLGDFNDGPGLDEYERLFGRSGVEIVRGADDEPQLYDPHAELAVSRNVGFMPASARFWLADRGRWMQSLLDYVFVSPDLRSRARDWRIWHPFDDPVCYRTPELREALLTASDHFPVSVELDV